MSSQRPIPFQNVHTMFWSHVGDAPDWFACDEEVVDAKKFCTIEKALEWIERLRKSGREIPRVIATGDDGRLYWLYNEERVVLNAFGNPDFTGDAVY